MLLRQSRLQKKLEKMGIDPKRLRLEYVSAAEGAKFVEVINNFTAAMAKLGTVTLNAEQEEKLLEWKGGKGNAKKAKGKAKIV
ncbi:MAG: hydrogenase iron-sulfur subunit [Deltaproteobacteria bacterium]|nr:hydrogenase iron-sulfur subunit [Deltaproteobacteria bacterium]